MIQWGLLTSSCGEGNEARKGLPDNACVVIVRTWPRKNPAVVWEKLLIDTICSRKECCRHRYLLCHWFLDASFKICFSEIDGMPVQWTSRYATGS